MGFTIDDSSMTNLQIKISGIPQDTELFTELHNTLAKYMEPYVPMREGMLAHNIEVTPEHVRYASKYAHYQYTGIVYGPNIPIMQDGMIVGWFSQPGITKHPTGAALTYNPELHPLATHHWDQAMLRDRKDELIADLTTQILRRLKMNNG